MPPRPVVESRDVVEDRRPGVFARPVRVLVHELGLERVEEAFGDRVVETASAPAGAQDEPVALGQLVHPERPTASCSRSSTPG